MRFGARTTLLPSLGLIAAGLVVFAQAPVGGDYATHVLPVMILLGAHDLRNAFTTDSPPAGGGGPP